jgi:hypothetical protein
VFVYCSNIGGRRPAGLVEQDPGATSVGDVLAGQAYLEAASVDAFLDLAEQVERHGGPARLVRRLRRAAGDEVRHARDVSALARRRGVDTAAVSIARTGPRSLLALALENAREGCVRETWAAAIAVAQGERAEDPEVRTTMRKIARDELGHAALSWDIGQWVEAQLTDAERAAVAEERRSAIAELEAQIGEAMPPSWRRTLGVPSREERQAMFAAMRTQLWLRS